MGRMDIFKERIEELIDLANRTIATKQTSAGIVGTSWVNSELFLNFEPHRFHLY